MADTVDEHPEPCAKLAGIFSVIALESGADQLIFEPGENDYRVFVLIDGKRHELRPPPAHLRHMLPDVFKAIAGIEPMNDHDKLCRDVVIRYSEPMQPDWTMRVEIARGLHGETVILIFPEARVADVQMLEPIFRRSDFYSDVDSRQQ